MASLQAPGLSINSLPSSSSFSSSSRRLRKPHNYQLHPLISIKSALHVQSNSPSRSPSPKQLQNLKLVQQQLERSMKKESFRTQTPFEDLIKTSNSASDQNLYLAKLYAILESISDRIEMHKNIGEQRQSWNTLLLTSINTITLTAATMSAIGGSIAPGSPTTGLKVSATVLFSAATGLLIIMNKLQPSQLVEEQRNAVRLFKQLESSIKTKIALGSVTEAIVEEAMEKVLAIDRAYPLPLIGVMLEKFPEQFTPAKWWPSLSPKKKNSYRTERVSNTKANGWNEKLEEDMREVVNVMKEKDMEDYMKLGKKALGVSKILATSGPFFTGLAAVGSLFAGHGQWGGALAAVAGSLASVVNTIEHGGQVGMVLEMYRDTAGYIKLMEETIGSTVDGTEPGQRENGEIFEMKVALGLGRSLSELRVLAAKSKNFCQDEFASKLF